MKTKDIFKIASVALGTATLTVMTFWSNSIEAVGEADAPAAKIAKPKLVFEGVEVTLAAKGGTLKAGDEPVFELTAINTTGEPAAALVGVSMTSTSPADMLSRVLTMPTKLWQHEQTLALKSHETKTVTLPASSKLPANRMIAVSLQAVDPLKRITSAYDLQARPGTESARSSQTAIVALNFSTVTTAKQPVLVSAQTPAGQPVN